MGVECALYQWAEGSWLSAEQIAADDMLSMLQEKKSGDLGRTRVVSNIEADVQGRVEKKEGERVRISGVLPVCR